MSADFEDNLHSFEACRKVLNNKISRTMSCMNMELRMVPSLVNSGKGGQNIIYMWDSLEEIVPRMRLALENYVLTMICS